MTTGTLKGVIAAIATPLAADGTPDCARLIARARYQLDNGCDGINLLGTTGEATSFTVSERLAVMKAVADARLPLSRFMVGTGAAATGDAETLTTAAADLGFAGALLLPPFYYSGISDDGLARYIESVLRASGNGRVPLYLYNFPALSGVPYTATAVALLLARFGTAMAGLKDSSGDIAYAASIAALDPRFSVFPSNEAILLRARAGDFAGCISATANLNSQLCAAAFHQGDETALEHAKSVRALFDKLPLVPGIKAVLAQVTGDAAWTAMAPPLTVLSAEHAQTLLARIAALPEVARPR